MPTRKNEFQYVYRIGFKNKLKSGKKSISLAWRVSCPPIKTGELRYEVYFYDNSYGSQKLALEAALAARDKYLRENKLLKLLERQNNKNIVRRSVNNSSGIIGVYRTKRNTWNTQYYENSKKKVVGFSIKEYNNCGAFQRACKERFQKCGELIRTKVISDLPCKPSVPSKYIPG